MGEEMEVDGKPMLTPPYSPEQSKLPLPPPVTPPTLGYDGQGARRRAPKTLNPAPLKPKPERVSASPTGTEPGRLGGDGDLRELWKAVKDTQYDVKTLRSEIKEIRSLINGHGTYRTRQRGAAPTVASRPCTFPVRGGNPAPKRPRLADADPPPPQSSPRSPPPSLEETNRKVERALPLLPKPKPHITPEFAEALERLRGVAEQLGRAQSAAIDADMPDYERMDALETRFKAEAAEWESKVDAALEVETAKLNAGIIAFEKNDDMKPVSEVDMIEASRRAEGLMRWKADLQEIRSAGVEKFDSQEVVKLEPI